MTAPVAESSISVSPAKMRVPVMAPVVWNVHDFVMVQSVSEGPDMRYEVLARFPLNKV